MRRKLVTPNLMLLMKKNSEEAATKLQLKISSSEITIEPRFDSITFVYYNITDAYLYLLSYFYCATTIIAMSTFITLLYLYSCHNMLYKNTSTTCILSLLVCHEVVISSINSMCFVNVNWGRYLLKNYTYHVKLTTSTINIMNTYILVYLNRFNGY